MSQVASSAKMVGRDAELATLLEAFDQARDGHPATVVIRGEAGIGKTRLLHEFLEQADRRTRPGDLPVIVAQGQCVDLGPVGAAFAPMRRVLQIGRASCRGRAAVAVGGGTGEEKTT